MIPVPARLGMENTSVGAQLNVGQKQIVCCGSQQKKERRKEIVGIQGKRLRMLLSSHFPLILLYEAHSKALRKQKYFYVYIPTSKQ